MLASALRARKCASTHIVLFDFLAPRLLAAPTASTPFWTGRSSSSTNTFSVAHRPIALRNIGDADPNQVNSEIARLRDAMHKNNVLTVWASYRALEKKGLLFVLGPPHFSPISKMIVDLSSVDSVAENWTEEQRHAIEELAFACARAGHTDALRQLLLRHILREDPDTVTRLYERFDQNLLEQDKRGLEATMEDENLDSTSVRFENPVFYRSQVCSILVAAVAAHALRDSFTDALNLVLKRSEYRISPLNVKHMFQDLKHCRDLEEKTLAYCETASMAALVQRPEAFKAHVRNLSASMNTVDKLRKVANAILRGFAGPLPWAALNKAETTRPVIVLEKIWADLLSALIVAHREEVAQNLWSQILELGIVPSVTIWNGLLEGYRETRQVQKFLTAWKKMEEEGIHFDVKSYGAKINCLLEGRLKNSAMKAFEEFKRAIPTSMEGVFVYNSVLDGLLSQDDTKTATKVSNEMAKRGLVPDIVTYNTYIKYYGRNGDLKGIAGIVNQLTENGVLPDVVTFTTILSSMLKARIPNASERLLGIMENMNVEQNVATYSAIIDNQVRTGTKEGIRSAWEILQRMENMKKAQPNVITYTSFLAGVHRSRELDKELITSISKDIVSKMEKRGVRPRRGTYHVLLKACLDDPTPEGLAFFMDYYNAILRSDVTFAHDTWFVILRGLLQRDEWALANEMVDQMLRSKFQPMWGVRDMVIRIRRWRAINHRQQGSLS